MDFVEVAVLCSINGFSARGLLDRGVGSKREWVFAYVDVMILLGRLNKLLVVLEFSAARGSVDLLSGVAFLLIGTSGCVACADRGEDGVGMMHVLENIFTGHS